MRVVKDRIRSEGHNLGGGILMVDGFINSHFDPDLMEVCGRELAARFAEVHATKVLNAEISGIAPAEMTTNHLGLPVVYARKHKPVAMTDQVFLTLAPSHTKGRTVKLIVSPEFLREGESVLIVDDFLASGQTILSFKARLAGVAGAIIVSVGTLVEKTVESGYDTVAELNVPVESLVATSDVSDGKFIFAD